MVTSDYFTEWLETYVEPFKRPNTTDCYRRSLSYLPSSLTGCDLCDLQPMDIQRAINAIASDHPRTGQLTYAAMHAALGQAVRLRLIPYSPMECVTKPVHHAATAAVLRPDELRRYLAAARRSDCWALLLLMATLGLRRGEALGVLWADVQGDILHVQHQRTVTAHTYALAALKTGSSDRWLRLSPAVAFELAILPHGSAYVCDTRPKHLASEHYRAIAAAAVPRVTLHGLRHSAATYLAGSGTPIKLLQGILGHATYRLTADLYADHLRDADQTANDLSRLSSVILPSDF